MFFAEYPGQVENKESKEVSKNKESKEVSKNIPENTPEWQLKQTVESIKRKTNEYWSFFRNYPNDFHEEIDRSFGGMIKETVEAVWWIPEKKINWFDKSFEDWKNVKVIEENGTIAFRFSGEWNGDTIITLSNLKNIWDYLEQLNNKNNNDWNNIDNWNSGSVLVSAPKITVTNWNIENLPDFMKNLQFLQWGDIELSSNNTKPFMEIFETLNDRILKPKLLEFHGYVDNVRKCMEESLDKAKHAENWCDISVENNYSWPEDLDVFIDSLLVKINESWGFQLNANKVLLSLCILQRSISTESMYREINRRLWYKADEWINKKGETLWSENAVEFLQFSGEEFDFFIMNSDVLIDLARDQAIRQNAEKIGDVNIEIEQYQSDSNLLWKTITMGDDWSNRHMMTKIDPILTEKEKQKKDIQLKTNLILDCLNK